MFQTVVSLLMLCSLGAHTVLGCCWHHSHADAACETSAAENRDSLAHHPHIHLGCGGHHHHHSPGRASDSEEPAAPAECPQGFGCGELSCRYIGAAPCKLPMPEMQPWDATPVMALGVLSQLVVDAVAFHSPEAAPPPLSACRNLRQITQVWLL